MQNTPAAVIFDCDGVLVDSEVLVIEVEIAVLAECGLTYSDEEFRDTFLGLNDAAAHEIIERHAIERTGKPAPSDLRGRARQMRWDVCQARLVEVAGCKSAVSALRLPKAVASSTGSDFLHEKLRLTDLLAVFEPHFYSADLVARAKPHPDVFPYAADRLGVDPAACLAIEDSVNGVRSARAAGMTVWGFSGGSHMDPGSAARLLEAGAVEVVGNWAEAGRRFAGF